MDSQDQEKRGSLPPVTRINQPLASNTQNNNNNYDINENNSNSLTNTNNNNLREQLSASFHQADRIRYPSQDRTYLSRFSREPLVTTLTGFSQVANFMRNPYELINNVDEYVRHASGQRRRRAGDSISKTNEQDRETPSPGSSNAVVQELDTFTTGSPNSPKANTTINQSLDPQSKNILHHNQTPIPALPIIECEKKFVRLEPLTIEEYETNYRLKATDLELIDRVYLGSMANNQLRAALWPYLFGLVKHRGRFEKIRNPEGGSEVYVFVEHEANAKRWQELQRLFYVYQAQWKAILPDQELRFSTFRERKSLIERDVIRCDRLHPFYAEEQQNLSSLTNLLMTYMMYDFDIGYVQGMSDLAGPILYMYRGDVIKSFWIFVEVMKLFRRNFELTQKTIHFQLSCLYQLVKTTDPIFAQYLEENESSNCFFAFRAIVCLFKRELMREDEDDYTKVLDLWDSIWCVERRCSIEAELKALNQEDMQVDSKISISDTKESTCKPITEQPTNVNTGPFIYPYEPNQSDTPRHVLTETEIFILSLCLSMIRRERDLVLANRLDGTDIHLHFINPKLSTDLNGFIQHAINIYSYIKNDLDVTKLTSPKEESAANDMNPESPPGSAEGYDLLNDFLIINGSSGS